MLQVAASQLSLGGLGVIPTMALSFRDYNVTGNSQVVGLAERSDQPFLCQVPKSWLATPCPMK